MGSLFIVSLMAILAQGEVPATDRPQLLIAPGAKVTLKQMQIGDRPYINVQAGGETVTKVVLHPLVISRTDTSLIRSGFFYLFQFFAGLLPEAEQFGVFLNAIKTELLAQLREIEVV